jgi:hypothetical protein
MHIGSSGGCWRTLATERPFELGSDGILAERDSAL